MKCQSCGAELNNGEQFCRKCGSKVMVNNEQAPKPKKKKKYWLIPILLFIGLVLSMIISSVLVIYINSLDNYTNSSLINTLIIIRYIITTLGVISGFLILPGTIIAIIFSNID